MNQPKILHKIKTHGFLNGTCGDINTPKSKITNFICNRFVFEKDWIYSLRQDYVGIPRSKITFKIDRSQIYQY